MDNVDKIKLPSAGLLGAPEEVTVRGMRGVEISTIYSSLNETSIEQVLQAVTTEELDLNKMCDEDKQVILHKTRTLTFGDDIQQTMRCPFCGNIQEHTVSYNDFNTVMLTPEELDRSVELSDGSILTARVPNKAVNEAINTYKKKRNLPASYAYLLLAASKVKTINGEKKSISDIVLFLEKLPGQDILEVFEGLTVKFGLDTTFLVPCESCKIEYPGGVGLNADMFR